MEADLTDNPIHTIRNRPVLVDTDRARIYGVETKVFNQAFKRNAKRFPDDFTFQLTCQELTNLRSQSVIPSSHGGRRSAPWAITEHGALMSVMILNSEKAVAMSVFVVRAFVQQREALAANAAILKHLAEIDRSLLVHDAALQDLYQKLLPLLQPGPAPERRRIGFHKEGNL